jgi:hypothetical protein
MLALCAVSSSLELCLDTSPSRSNISSLICILLLNKMSISSLGYSLRLFTPWISDFEEEEESSGVCYAILDQFFSQCQGIRNLKIMCFNFGDDPSTTSQIIKDGFYRLSQLSLEECRGDLRMFVVYVPIPNLISFSNLYWDGDSDIVSAVAINYPTITSLRLDDDYTSSVSLLKFIECCREIEELSYRDCSGRDVLELKRSDIEVITSLPRLKSLNINCRFTDNAVSVLSRCRGLKYLALGGGSIDLTSILPNIGRNLLSLEVNSSNPCSFNAIIEQCPNLHMLNLRWRGLDTSEFVNSFKRRLKKLEKLKLGGMDVRVGTDWEGYHH